MKLDFLKSYLIYAHLINDSPQKKFEKLYDRNYLVIKKCIEKCYFSKMYNVLLVFLNLLYENSWSNFFATVKPYSSKC